MEEERIVGVRTETAPASEVATPVVSPSPDQSVAGTERDDLEQLPSGSREKIRELRGLLKNESANAYQLGKGVNSFEEEGLAIAAGYRNVRACLSRLLGADKFATIYRYARVAKHFSAEDATQHGISKLEMAMRIQTKAHGTILPRNIGDYDVGVPNKDNSITVKKFRDCSYRDLKRTVQSQTRAKLAKPIEDPGKPPDAAGESAGKSNPGAEKPAPVLMRRPVETLALGVFLTIVGEVTGATVVGSGVRWVGSAFLIWGIVLCIRSWIEKHALPHEWNKFVALLASWSRWIHRTTRSSARSKVVDGAQTLSESNLSPKATHNSSQHLTVRSDVAESISKAA